MANVRPLHAVVTGAGGGLGRALAVEIASRGGKVVVSDIDAAAAEETASMLRAAGAKAWSRQCDVSDPVGMDGLAREAETLMDGVTFVANNAGVAVGGPFESIALEDWRWIVDVNLWGVIHGCRSFVPRIRARGGGWVLNVASAAGFVAAPHMAPYNVTKAAVIGLSETLAAELRECEIKVTVLCPTFFRTNIAKSGRGSASTGQLATVEKLMARSKLQAPEVARLAIDGVFAGKTYVVPMSDGRALWWLKRLVPEYFPEIVRRGGKRIAP